MSLGDRTLVPTRIYHGLNRVPTEDLVEELALRCRIAKFEASGRLLNPEMARPSARSELDAMLVKQVGSELPADIVFSREEDFGFGGILRKVSLFVLRTTNGVRGL